MKTYCLSCKKYAENINPKVIIKSVYSFCKDLVGLIV